MRILHAAFIVPIAPDGSVDGTVGFVTTAEATLELDGAFLRVAWLRSPRMPRLVPLTNVRELQCVDEAPEQPAPPPTSKRPRPRRGDHGRASSSRRSGGSELP